MQISNEYPYICFYQMAYKSFLMWEHSVNAERSFICHLNPSWKSTWNLFSEWFIAFWADCDHATHACLNLYDDHTNSKDFCYDAIGENWFLQMYFHYLSLCISKNHKSFECIIRKIECHFLKNLSQKGSHFSMKYI